MHTTICSLSSPHICMHVLISFLIFLVLLANVNLPHSIGNLFPTTNHKCILKNSYTTMLSYFLTFTEYKIIFLFLMKTHNYLFSFFSSYMNACAHIIRPFSISLPTPYVHTDIRGSELIHCRTKPFIIRPV